MLMISKILSYRDLPRTPNQKPGFKLENYTGIERIVQPANYPPLHGLPPLFICHINIIFRSQAVTVICYSESELTLKDREFIAKNATRFLALIEDN